MTMKTTAILYWDTQSPDQGWAWSVDGEGSGPVDGDLPESAELVDVLDAAGSDLPEKFWDADVSIWTQSPDGVGWVASV